MKRKFFFIIVALAVFVGCFIFNVSQTDIENTTEIESEIQTESEKTEVTKPRFTYCDMDLMMYACTIPSVKNLPSEEGEKLGTLSYGEKVHVTARCNETGWYRIEYEDDIAYVSSLYLVVKQPSSKEIVKLTDANSILENWETIPAGTIIDEKYIDFHNLSKYFKSYKISYKIYNFINGRSFVENPDVAISDLRYIKVLHYNFNHELQVGELIVAKDLSSDYRSIFKALLKAEYEIYSMYLPDNYWTGDPTKTDSASIDVNNTSCFMYRPATGSSKLSKHSFGYAIDINPQQNPYVDYSSGSPVWKHENASDYIDRTTGLEHMIIEDDICYKIFKKYGFSWGGLRKTKKDYQHFYVDD